MSFLPVKDNPSKRTGSPVSVETSLGRPLKDREAMLGLQMKKLHEMRASQVAFFDNKIIELRKQESMLNAKSVELAKKESDLILKEAFVKDLLERLRMEREEIDSIKDLLRTETESIQLQSRDLRRLVSKCEKFLSPITKAS